MFTGVVIRYDLIRGEWVIRLDAGEDEVFVDPREWGEAKFVIGQAITFGMINRPQGVYALPPVRVIN